jgi:hypothetical protein
MKVLFFSDLSEIQGLNEALININELEKPSDIGKRGDTLIQILSSNKTVKINGNDIIISNSDDILDNITDEDGNYDSDKAKLYFVKGSRYKQVIQDEEGNTYRLNQIEKTDDFGSNRGSSLGSTETSEVESIQCIFFAFRQELGRGITYYDKSRIKKELITLSNSVETAVLVTPELIDKHWSKWKSSFVKTANSMYEAEDFSGYGDTILNKRFRYKFAHIGSKGICSAIKDAYKRCKQGSNIFPEFSKWCPADVWVVSQITEQVLIDYLNRIDTFNNLNHFIDTMFNYKKLIGMSLKKVSQEENIKLVINKFTKPPKYRLNSVKVSFDPTSSINVDIITKRLGTKYFPEGLEKMTVRSFSGNSKGNVSGEITGKTAKHGKISLNSINDILIKYGLDPVPLYNNDRNYNTSISDMTDEELMEEIEVINDKIIKRYENFSKSRVPKNISRVRLISKYQGLFLSWVLMYAKDEESSPEKIENEDGIQITEPRTIADKVIQEMFHYALSINTTGTPKGRTPRFVRIVD